MEGGSLLMLAEVACLTWEEETEERNEYWSNKKLKIENKHDSVAEVNERIAKFGGGGGEEIQLVLEKTLTVTDMNGGQGRLSLPGGYLKNVKEFLTEEERLIVDGAGLKVSLLGRDTRLYPITLKRWNNHKPNKKGILVLSGDGQWNAFANDNFLSPQDLIQLWSFRRDSNLYFTLLKIV